MKKLLIGALLLLFGIVSGCETPQDAQPDNKPVAFDSTASIEFTELNDTTYRFVMRKADVRLSTRWKIEGSDFAGDTLIHSFMERGLQEIIGQLVDSNESSVRSLDTLIYVDTVGIAPAIFHDCSIIFEFAGSFLELSRMGTSSEYKSRFTYKAFVLTERLLVGPVFTDTSFFVDTTYTYLGRNHVSHQLKWSLSADFDSLNTLTYSYSDSLAIDDDKITWQSAVMLKGAKLVRATADEVVYQLSPADSSRVDFDFEQSNTGNYTVSGLHSIDWSVPSYARIIFRRK